ncbi:MAG: 4-(cytidine 5'-diphospho)-2-C-methyl-D-erythritol kinase [Verrucomicrobiales bacterium]|nr:4-(cytidine 5'-diphospho)-2-C-methyl-D-erythritol kinase [Verrucomicrobiales bacterium]
MSEKFEIEAPAKTNLWLEVLGKREDGFHEIRTLMVCLSLADQLKLEWRDDDEVVLNCSDPALPTGEENLVIKAVRAMEKHTGKVFALTIELEKRIPSGAGLGGGSSDAAAVIRAINEMADLNLSEAEMSGVAATIGSDIPFFIYNRPCFCFGRGEVVEPLDEPVENLPIFLIKPAFEISAGWAYRRYTDSGQYEGFEYWPQICPWGPMANSLERPVFEKYPLLGEMKSWLLRQPEVHAAIMSGSGSTMLAVLRKDAFADELTARAIERYGESSWTFCGKTL